LTFIHCTCKFVKHKQSFLSENYEQTFPDKKHKPSNLTAGALINAGKARYVMRTRVLRRPIVFLRFRCSILILLVKSVRCSIPHCNLFVGYERAVEKVIL